MHIHSTQNKFDNSSMLLRTGPHMHVYNLQNSESSLDWLFKCVCVNREGVIRRCSLKISVRWGF